MASIFENVPVGPQIEVFQLNRACVEDTFPQKVNLGIGGKFPFHFYTIYSCWRRRFPISKTCYVMNAWNERGRERETSVFCNFDWKYNRNIESGQVQGHSVLYMK